MNSIREDLPRVSIDSIQNWEHVKSRYAQAILTKLETELSATGTLEERAALLAHINEYIESTWSIARPNLRVNGQNLELLDEHGQDMEPFDESLDRRIWSLADTRLKWHKRIAETRRKVPATIENEFIEICKTGLQTDPSDVIDLVADDNTIYPQQSGYDTIPAWGDELNQMIPIQRERSEILKAVTTEAKALKM
ncbi:hypothetical protein BD779DRAFT_1500776 [Infundibulicybe gibba]|nr:hypothetical protein BD779DRAFT_1500776 [Infundibulicybe gibba]